MKKFLRAAMLFCLCLMAWPAGAVETSLAATVNDEVISKFDVEERLSLVALSTNIELNDENRQKIYPQILRNLIDERLQLQEARRMNIMVSEADLNSAIARLAQQNNMPPEGFEAHIESKGGSYDSLLDQIRATISWTKVVRQRFGTSVVIGQDDINAQIDKLKASMREQQYLVAEIALAVESPKDEPQVKELADRLVSEILGGTPFPPLARQFSQSPSAPDGGDLGWIKRGQLPDALDKRLATMQPNQISKPLRTADGYTILFLRETRIPTDADMPPIDRARVTEMLRQKKLETSARKYIRDLRSQALIEIRS
jgi:peptidyl-prolyl cis-trans isomerase SurA